MNIIEAIKERRSIRQYTEEMVSQENMKTLLESAMYAPSGGNAQPWDFVVIRDKDTLNKITQVHPYSHCLKNANCAIIVCGNLSKEKYRELWIQDCSAATQNILLSAVGLNLGAVWMGLYPEMDRVDGVREIIGAPSDVYPFSIVSIGHPNESKTTPDRFDPNNIHLEKW